MVKYLTKKRNRNNNRLVNSSHELRDAAAKCLLTPSESAANAIHSMTKNMVLDESGTTGADFPALVDNLEAVNERVANGDLRSLEAMLLDQAHVLQTAFMIYTQKMSCSEHTEQLNAFSRIALRAQNQCRQTLATLVELKSPKRATFIKQQNNAVNQQINQQPEIRKNLNDRANELLGDIPNEQLVARTAQASCRTNQGLEAVGEVDRTEDR